MLTQEGHFLLGSITLHLGVDSKTEAVRVLLDRESGRFDPLLAEAAKKPGKKHIGLSIEDKYITILRRLGLKWGGLTITDTLERIVRENAARLEVQKQHWSKRIRKIPAGTPAETKSFHHHALADPRKMVKRLEEMEKGRRGQ
jgi:hypothetical protein